MAIRDDNLRLAGILTGLIAGTPWMASAALAAAPAEIKIPGDKVYPESITSSADGRVIIGSIAHREILAVKPGQATAEHWIAADGNGKIGVFGVFAHDKSSTLWACFSAYPGSGGPAPAELKSFDLTSGKLKAHYVLPGKETLCNDIAVGADGSVYATDSEAMQIDRLPPGGSALEVWAGNGAFGGKGKILDGISVLGSRIIVNVLETGRIFGVDIGAGGKAGNISEVKLNRPIAQPDGMRSYGKDSVLVIESGDKGRLSKLVIHGNSGEVTTLKEGYPQGPVSVTLVGGTAYVLEGQLDALFGDSGKHPPQPFHATAVDIGAP